MKSFIKLILILILTCNVNAQVGIGNTDPQGALDIFSTDNGLLIPRVALSTLNDENAVLTPTQSELVYNTNVDITENLELGYYYLASDMGPWVKLGGASAPPPPPPPPVDSWLITGNDNIVEGTNFLGTLAGTNVDVVFRRNGDESGRLSLNNTSFGAGALPTNNANAWNTAVGTNALGSLTGGGRNVAIGHNALESVTSASFNVAIGFTALEDNTGQWNTAIGYEALKDVFDGAAQHNVALGYQAMDQAVGITNFNVALGSWSLRNANGGTQNTAVGSGAGTGITGGDTNIAIGFGAQVPNGGLSNQLSIGNWIYRTSTGNVGINTAAPSAILSVNGQANKPGGGAWAVFSDRRSKENIETYTNGLNELMKINPVKFNYKKEFGWGTKTYVGLIAQDIQKVVPSMVTEKEVNDIKDFKEVDPNELTYILINSIKEQQVIIEKLKKDNEELKAVNAEILKRLEALEKK